MHRRLQDPDTADRGSACRVLPHRRSAVRLGAVRDGSAGYRHRLVFIPCGPDEGIGLPERRGRAVRLGVLRLCPELPERGGGFKGAGQRGVRRRGRLRRRGAAGAGRGPRACRGSGPASDSAAQALNLSQNYIAGLAINFGAAALLLAAGAAALISGRLPAWIRWLSIVAGVVSLIPVPNIGALTVSVWTLAVSITLFVRRAEIVAAEREPALT